jgi:hypothetical protein
MSFFDTEETHAVMLAYVADCYPVMPHTVSFRYNPEAKQRGHVLGCKPHLCDYCGTW